MRHPPLLLHPPAAVMAAAAQLAAWGWSASEVVGMLRRCPFLLMLRLKRPRYAARLRFLQARRGGLIMSAQECHKYWKPPSLSE